MLSERDYENIVRPIIEIYSELELELIELIASKFDIYDPISGSLEWYLKKLNELGGLNNETIKIIAKYSNKTEKKIISMLEEVGYKAIDFGDLNKAYELGIFNINPESISLLAVLDNSFVEIDRTVRLINTKALEAVKNEYISILNKAYIEVSTGLFDTNTSIRRALGEMADRGITAATYVNSNGRLTRYNIEGVVRRDIVTAVNQTANKCNDEVAKQVEATHFYVTEHLGARNKGNGHKNHEDWQGQVYLINGETEEYKNFYIVTGYGLVDGLAGVNCRHQHYVFIVGVSKIPPKLIDDKENSRVYELTQKQRYLERLIRKDKRNILVDEKTNDTNMLKKHTSLLSKHRSSLRELIKNNKELKRDYIREKI